MNLNPQKLRLAAMVAGGLFLAGFLLLAGVSFYLSQDLPSIESLRDSTLQVPLRVYSRDGALIGEFGEEKRTPLKYADFPPLMVKAVLAAEDDRFFEHHGVDPVGLLRAGFYLVRHGEKGQGGSTITMQVARNFFLSSEKTFTRKIKEILLALKIDRELSKEEILELYLNKIYLGNRAYGVAAAAQIYYGKNINDLKLPEIAMIAGLPKAPSSYNPVVNPARAGIRRDYVIGRMQELGFITAAEAEQARTEPVTATLHAQQGEVDALYLAEMVRADMVARFGTEATYTAGYKVYTTINAKDQQAANVAVRSALIDYERRHGYRGPEGHEEFEEQGPAEWDVALEEYKPLGGLQPAIVVKLEEKAAQVYVGQPELARIEWAGLEWAKPFIDDERVGNAPAKASDILKVGDIIRVEQTADGKWLLAQVPQVSAALIALRPKDGAVLSLVGGFDFTESKFNRVIQAQRQPGSSFKPFIYSSALEKGFTPASVINDAPVVFQDNELEGAWRPENFSGKFYGPTRLREALVNSRNLVSIRILQAVGVGYALDYVGKFGFNPGHLPRNLSLALGSGSITPMELVRGYATFANGGFLVNPYYIERVEDAKGNVVMTSEPVVACPTCDTGADGQPTGTAFTPEGKAAKPAPRAISERNVYLMTSMMQDVVKRGTARRAMELGRNDLAGKTGTTNDQRDAWFCGFNGEVATTTWIGFDSPRPLGSSETGAGASLPIWIDYMRVALSGMPERSLAQPQGLVTVRINGETGRIAAPGEANALFETFYSENVPEAGGGKGDGSTQGTSVTEQLF
jgi:penicillin-binding protein 1A